MSKCEHKFRTNLDNIKDLTAISPYVTVVFCEKCGFIVHDTNNPSLKALLNKEQS